MIDGSFLPPVCSPHLNNTSGARKPRVPARLALECGLSSELSFSKRTMRHIHMATWPTDCPSLGSPLSRRACYFSGVPLSAFSWYVQYHNPLVVWHVHVDVVLWLAYEGTILVSVLVQCAMMISINTYAKRNQSYSHRPNRSHIMFRHPYEGRKGNSQVSHHDELSTVSGCPAGREIDNGSIVWYLLKVIHDRNPVPENNVETNGDLLNLSWINT